MFNWTFQGTAWSNSKCHLFSKGMECKFYILFNFDVRFPVLNALTDIDRLGNCHMASNQYHALYWCIGIKVKQTRWPSKEIKLFITNNTGRNLHLAKCHTCRKIAALCYWYQCVFIDVIYCLSHRLLHSILLYIWSARWSLTSTSDQVLARPSASTSQHQLIW